ncbi:phospholipase D-like domain-containing protein [Spirillospora sp. NPDC127200]
MLHSGSLLTLAGNSGPRLHATLTAPDDIPDLTNRKWDAVTQLRDGDLLRLDGRRLFRGRSAYARQWTQVAVPDELVIADIATLPDGDVLCLTDKGRFWSCAPDLQNWRQRNDISLCGLARVEALPDDSLLGVSWDRPPDEPGDLYYLPPDRSGWRVIESSRKLSNVIALPGGALLGVTPVQRPNEPDRKPIISYTSPAPWRSAGKPPVALAALTRGLALDELLALGADGNLYTGKTASNGEVKWAPSQLPAPAFKVVSIAGSPRTGAVYAVSSDTTIHRYTLDKKVWTQSPDRNGLHSVAVIDSAGTFVAAGPPQGDGTAKRYLFQKDWSELPAGPAVVSLGAAHDGSVLETRPDGTVHQRPSYTDAPVPCGITGTAQVVYAGDLVDDSPERWLLQHTSQDYESATGNGRPWGDGTAMAARAQRRQKPWDEGNRVTPFIGGGETLAAIRDCLEAAINEAEVELSTAPPGRRGHVYIADWLLNGLRDLSEDNAWGVGPWKDHTGNVAKDQTALGLIGRLMAAGVKVRVLVWMPTSTQGLMTGPQNRQHAALAAAIEELNAALCAKSGWAAADPIGVCALDLRTAPSISSSLHQKTVVVRVGSVNVAFCGGVDLAFTRRDARRPLNAMAGEGDWQSGETIPVAANGWPRAAKPAGGKPVAFPFAADEKEQFPDELAADVYGQPRHWHDQHLKLEGPIVATLEEQFDERWRLPANVAVFDPKVSLLKFWEKYQGEGWVLFSSAKASPTGKSVAIPSLGPVSPPPACGEATVQMWRTIPVGANRGGALFARGEFTVMAGVANAVARAEKLITIWDQYFWSEPLARLLAHRVAAVPGLRLVVVLPAHGSNKPPTEMGYRRRALTTLWNELGSTGARDRVLVLDAWNHARNVGIYVHAKVQTYDDCLLVCGSANMNRRSFTNDMELDVAVLHRPTVRWHLARLAHMVLGRPWTDFGDGWADKLFAAVQGAAKTTLTPGSSLIPDPFFGTAHRTHTPNGIAYAPDSTFVTESGFEPSSLPTKIETIKPAAVGYQADGNATGRLDLLVHLIERQTEGKTFPYRQ